MAGSLLALVVLLIWLRLVLVTVLALRAAATVDRSPHVAQGASDVTILIPARDEAAVIERTLAATAGARAAGAALVVVDDGSGDRTAALVAAQGFARLIRLAAPSGKAAALNAGLAEIRTPLVLTLDADTELADGALERAVARLARDRGAAVVAFDVCVRPSAALCAELQGVEYDASLNFERRGQAVLGAISVAPGAASLWRLDDLRAIGGFSGATATEDVDATLALAARGRRAAHCSGARAYTMTPATAAALLAQRRRWCLGHYQAIWRRRPRRGDDALYRRLTYPNFFLLSAFMPIVGALSVASLFADSGAWRLLLGATTGLWLATVYAQRALALRLARRGASAAAFILEPVATLALHLAAALLVLWSQLARLGGSPLDPWSGRSRG